MVCPFSGVLFHMKRIHLANFIKNKNKNKKLYWAWWPMTIISALGWLKRKDCELLASLSNVVRPCIKIHDDDDDDDVTHSDTSPPILSPPFPAHPTYVLGRPFFFLHSCGIICFLFFWDSFGLWWPGLCVLYLVLVMDAPRSG